MGAEDGSSGANARNADGSNRWCLIESDPGVFTELVEKVGVKGVEFDEIFGVDEESFEALKQRHRKIFGFVFLFNWTKDAAGAATGDAADSSQDVAMDDALGAAQCPPDLFFAKQVIENACASQAILSVLVNKREEIQDVGSTINALVDFTKDFVDPQMRGEAIGNSELIRAAHNSFRSSSPFDWTDDDDDKEKEDAFHFVSYIFFKGHAYEMDGLKPGPQNLGSCGEDSWTELVRKRLQSRIAKIQTAASGELRFNLMAVTEDNLSKVQQDLLRERVVIQRAKIKLISSGQDIELDDEVDDDQAPSGTPTMEELPDDIAALEKVVREAEDRKKLLKEQEEEELDKRARWKKENARRRHDFVPFLLTVIKHLARKGELVKSVTAAQETIARRQHERKKAKTGATGVST
ncbi:ubiquitin carboxyl-terminal hydrolase, family 1 protein [Toxoplasma gondii ME49]|uniref:ubiquitinyl hydrolase 1 n=6 Tax=Toxoplasma gondii TaxID=5811 RepID=B6KGW8_TOXGV|nr:ubiquitin carboxyl-terminal hydrolase, family 1 protein [Toxoplasma gondii ME49]EPT24912.1 ubiquitin carboxyl-terminal hydrolase, family 1 protein [Toxoplasma gondii ME49]ESS34152.1 ubiquitin carboxyl-terminal hydrolase, family 1 protein [Toxoplasma gondii VEG]CEL78377.1 TPA: ubiquitin carboxyl-terminal hydrolase isozyme L5, putative [Toxoplasma gondii VEG]|eukprot:XP_002367091.1 ubiquitin carboxyl-terminal hydrolase, family 1 protein [Toxoplasma gondii ME49]